MIRAAAVGQNFALAGMAGLGGIKVANMMGLVRGSLVASSLAG